MTIATEIKNKKHFTLYWLDGKREVVIGDTIHQAFTLAGYGGGAVKVLDWYDYGVSETHRWNSDQKRWEPYTSHRVQLENLDLNDPGLTANLVTTLEWSHSITVVMPDKSEFLINYQISRFAMLGWQRYIQVMYGEYQTGAYDGSDDEPFHFIATGTEYFDPAQPQHAVEAFVQRLRETPSRSSGMGSRLEELKQQQFNL